MEKNVFLRLAEERYTTKHYNGKMIPRVLTVSVNETV